MPRSRKLIVLAVCLALFTSHMASAAPGEVKAEKTDSEKSAESTADEGKDELLKVAESGLPPRIVKQVNHVNEDNSYTVGHAAEDGTFKIETRTADGHIRGMFAYLDAAGALKRFVYSTRPEDAALILPSAPTTTTNLLHVADSAGGGGGQEGRKAPAVRRQLRYRRPQGSESPEDPSPVLSMLLRRSRQGPRTDADELLRIQQQQYLYQGDSGDVYGSGYHVADAQLRQQLRGRVQNAVLRQLTPPQLAELQQYVTPEARRALNPSLRALMSPVLDYLSGREELYDPYLFYPGQQVQYPVMQRQQVAGYGQPGLYDDLRYALLQRVMLAARLLGVDGSLGLGRYGGYDNDQYSDRLLGRFYTQPDPRLAYNLRSLPYQQALQIARETHERQLAAYQASIAAQGGAVRAVYPRGEVDPTPFVIHTPETTPGAAEYEYSTVTPASVVRATSARPSNIQRVRNVQVIPGAAPSPSTTASSRGY
ncbi:Hypothetical predicted protein [Cloeon dipterum]|uniref:Uncharacterized protein n=1 Tax=Cloeon dipterum TaxID=197152 RepID=A0A8S1CC83_9INSE|nr:Hypothetical predicted protein [Cloeon dipterum]